MIDRRRIGRREDQVDGSISHRGRQAGNARCWRRVGDDKLLVWGEGPEGELLQVVYVLDDDGTAFVLHARPLTPREKRLHRRQGRR